MKRAKKLPRRSVHETRQLLLDAGGRLLDDYQKRSDSLVFSDALRHVRMTEILDVATGIEARRHAIEDAAPITTGAAYHAFPGGEDEFREELLKYVIATERTMEPEVVANEVVLAIAESGEEPPPLSELVRRVTAAAYFHARTLPGVYTRIGFFAFSGHPEVARLLAKNYRDTIDSHGVSALYETLLHQYRLRVRPPLTVQDLATTLLALMEGFVLRSRVEPEAVPDAVPWEAEEWSLFSIGCHAVIVHFTEPADDGDP